MSAAPRLRLQQPAPAGDLCLITPLEAARRLGLAELRDPHRAVLGMVRRHELRGVRVGKMMRIDPRSIDRFIEGAGGVGV